MNKIKTAIVGATGYAGIKLYELLRKHPFAEVVAMVSRSNVDEYVSVEFPHLLGKCNLKFVDFDNDILTTCDLIFFATPHGVAMKSAKVFLDKGIKVIDLGADFRIKDNALWSKWYGMKHSELELLKTCTYGLPETYAKQIKTANLIANPGCYPTVINLGLKPFLEQKLINTTTIIADCKSGVSGAGRTPQLGTLLCEASENLKPYAVNHHRHKPEIEQELSKLAGAEVSITFVPHLIPMQVGMLVTIYVDLLKPCNAQELLIDYYQDNKMVHILTNSQPQTKSVVGTNNCQIAVKQTGNKLIITAVIDNLIKGASGQAVQNMNLMFALEVNEGLL